MDIILNLAMAALAPLKLVSLSIAAVLPAICAALLLLLLGVFIGHWARHLVEHVLKMIKIDDHVRKVGLPNILGRLGMGTSLTRLTGVVVYSVIILSFILGAGEALGLSIVSDFLHRIVLFVPTLIAVVVVMGGGLFIGDLLGDIVHRASRANRIKGADALMRMTHGLVVLFSGVIALEMMGIDIRFFLDYMTIIVATVGLACAIAFGVAFGFAGKDMAGRLIRDLTPKGSSSSEPKMRVVK